MIGDDTSMDDKINMKNDKVNKHKHGAKTAKKIIDLLSL